MTVFLDFLLKILKSNINKIDNVIDFISSLTITLPNDSKLATTVLLTNFEVLELIKKEINESKTLIDKINPSDMLKALTSIKMLKQL